MTKSDYEVIENCEARLLKASCAADFTELSDLVHSGVIFTDENGQMFTGIDNLQINDSEILSYKKIDVKSRNIALFNDVAIVTTLEQRAGRYQKLDFDIELSLTRVWKFQKSKWMLIAATVVML